jgi:hypothetical protein
MVKQTQSNRGLERKEDPIQQRTMYDSVSQQFASCIRDTRSRSLGREFDHAILQHPSQRRQKNQGQTIDTRGQGAYERIQWGCRSRPVCQSTGNDTGKRTDSYRNRNSGRTTSINIRTHSSSQRIISQAWTDDKCGSNRCRLYRRNKGGLANPGTTEYQVQKGERIAQLIIEKISNEELYEVQELEETNRGDKGFGSTDPPKETDKESATTRDQDKMEICEISARAFGSYYRKGETTGILRWDPVKDKLEINAIHVSTEIAIRNKKEEDKRELHEVVPKEYHHLLDVFEKEEKTGLPPIAQESTWKSIWNQEKKYP